MSMSPEAKNIGITVTLSGLVTVATILATFSFNQGADDKQMEQLDNRVAALEHNIGELGQIPSSIDLLRQEIGYLRDDFDDLKQQNRSMSDDLKQVNSYIARQEGREAALKSIRGDK